MRFVYVRLVGTYKNFLHLRHPFICVICDFSYLCHPCLYRQAGVIHIRVICDPKKNPAIGGITILTYIILRQRIHSSCKLAFQVTGFVLMDDATLGQFVDH